MNIISRSDIQLG